eukprot:scaffold44755_cov19-Tisochrysis_lutea.AAC.1
MLATASADKTVKVWRTDTGELLQTLQGHTQGISDVAWTMAENYLCTASDDHTLKLWDVQTGRLRLGVNAVAHLDQGQIVKRRSKARLHMRIMPM